MIKKPHPRFEIDVKALVYDLEGKLLFAKDDNGKWDIPGGRMDENESVEECLKREITEELGVLPKTIFKQPKFACLMDFDDKEKRLAIGF